MKHTFLSASTSSIEPDALTILTFLTLLLFFYEADAALKELRFAETDCELAVE